MRSRFLLTVSATALLAGLGLTACGPSSTANPSKAAGAAPVSGAPAPAAPASAAPVPAAPIAGRSSAPVAASSATGIPTAPGSGSSSAPKCSAQSLRWTLTRLTDAGTDAKDPANAELVAVNSGSQSCTLAGYPKLEFHLGKGPQALGAGTAAPRR